MQNHVSADMNQAYDLLVVGGGINGVGIARDAVGRGLRVLLCEQNDLAQHTSSASTKLIHGGLRYLEYYEFKLVRKALQEREVLMRIAPHIIAPLRFVMPHDRSQRPAWMIRIGLFMYDHLARREFLPGSEGIRLDRHETGAPLQSGYKRGFVYSDGWVDDARLVVLNAMDAQARGARILTRTRCVSATRSDGRWQAQLQQQDGSTLDVTARAIVNAAGPWAAQFAGAVAPSGQKTSALRLIKGSHIVVPRIFDHDYAYIFQNPDKRIIFAIPYQGEFTLIGTTDLEYRGDPAKVGIEQDEIDYLCQASSRYFKRPITPDQVVWTYSGVRPLLDDESENASAITRDYVLEVDTGGAAAKGAPMLNVWGGKITTYRKLAEEALALLLPRLDTPGATPAPDWTDRAYLPGGDLQQGGAMVETYDVAAFVQKMAAQYPWLPEAVRKRYARNYGTRANVLLAGAQQVLDLGQELTPGLYEAEVRYLLEHEWAQTAEDILWRRSKLGLWAKPQQVAQLRDWLQQHGASGQALRKDGQ
jgi:glycerol-3-phosphate dehydrogenase